MINPQEQRRPRQRADPGPRDLVARYRTIRHQTERLCAPLSPEDCTAQSMDDASPAKWHLGHTTWFFETFVLERGLAVYRPFHPQFRVLFNSYYNSVGEQHPRPRRGLLTRPTRRQVLAYRRHVDDLVATRLEDGHPLDEAVAGALETGLQHEQQHQELILMDIKHLLSCNPLLPAYRECAAPPPVATASVAWHHFPEGVDWIGHDGKGFGFDNEGPRHRVFLRAYALASRPVTNGEFLAFMEDGGYTRPALWLSDGWSTVQTHTWRAPLYWEEARGGWTEMTLGGPRPLSLSAPVCHVSFYEADAFARWSGARLPTEAEWEQAAADASIDAGNFVESGLLHPTSVQGHDGLVQLLGDVWEWTASAYSPYPGYQAPSGALGEYNGKFMCNQGVLRGGCCVTPRSHIRVSYRNFFYPHQRWQFSGIRLARDA